MSIVHVAPTWEEHNTDGETCVCGPDRMVVGQDDAGKPAVVVVHRRWDN